MIENQKPQSIVEKNNTFDQEKSTISNESELFLESKERLESALHALVNGASKCAFYYAYTSMILSAKAFLWSKKIYKHTHLGVVIGFNAYLLEKSNIADERMFYNDFKLKAKNGISMVVAQDYVSKALAFNSQIQEGY